MKLQVYILIVALISVLSSCNNQPKEDGAFKDNNFYTDLKKNDKKNKKKNLTAGVPRIKFETDNYNFGEVKEGEQVYYQYKFTNTGNAPLLIENVTSTCGCTIPKWPTDPILPGRSGVINVRFDTRERPGEQSKAITVISNGEPYKSALIIRGNVIK